MIIVMKPSALPQDVDKIVDAVEKEGLKTHLSHGEEVTIIGDRKSTRLNSSHQPQSRMPSSA